MKCGLNNKTYDVLKYIVTIVIPALVTLLATVLGLFRVEAEIVAIVTGTLGAAGTFIGKLINVSSEHYWGEEGDE